MQACQTNPPGAVATEALAAGSESSTRALPPGAMTWFSFASAMLIAASSSAVTPLYHLYQASMHLTPFWITIVFASYVASLLAALLTVGGLSDYVGRRPVILVALLLNAAAMVLFSEAGDCRAVDSGTDGPGALRRRRHHRDGRGDPRYQPRPRTPAQQRHGLSRHDRRFAGRGGADHVRVRPAAPGVRGSARTDGADDRYCFTSCPKAAREKKARWRRCARRSRVPPQIARHRCQAHAGQRCGLGARRALPLADADRGGDRNGRRLALGRRRCGRGIDADRGDRGRGVSELASAAPDRDEHQHAGAGRGHNDDRNPATASCRAAGGDDDRRRGIWLDLFGNASGTTAHRRTPSARRAALGVLPAILPGVRSPAVVAGLSVPYIGLATTAYIYGAVIILLAFISMMASLWTDR